MNDNPGETPNPLNPNQEPVATPQPEQPTNVSPASNVLQAEPSSQPTQVEASVQPATGGVVESLDPTGRTMETAPGAEVPQKKKKTGLIVGIVIAVVVLIGGIVALILVLMNMSKTDAVAQAMNKLMSGNAPSNVAIDGTIDILPNDANSPISRVSITLDSDMIVSSNINTSTAVVTIATANDESYSVEFDEVYASSGDLYFKIDGASALLSNPDFLELLSGGFTSTDIDCMAGEEDCIVLETDNLIEIEDTEIDVEDEILDYTLIGDGLSGIIELIDGEWIRISTEEMGLLSDGIVSESEFSCVSNLVNDINKNSNSAAELYNKYPFFTSTNENLVVSSKNDPIYKLEIDAENFANFVNAMNNSSLSEDLYACLNWDNNVSITTEDAEEMINELPAMYVEIDANYNFTRLYTKTETEEGAEVIIDLSFTYPANVNVPEPLEYVDFSEVIQEIMQSMFDLESFEVEETPVEISE